VHSPSDPLLYDPSSDYVSYNDVGFTDFSNNRFQDQNEMDVTEFRPIPGADFSPLTDIQKSAYDVDYRQIPPAVVVNSAEVEPET